MVPSWLIARRKKHFIVLGNENEAGFDGVRVEVLLGCNGGIWIQTAMMELEDNGETGLVMEEVQKVWDDHGNNVLGMEARVVLAGVRNSIDALTTSNSRITPVKIVMVMKASAEFGCEFMNRLRPGVILQIKDVT